MELIKPEHLEWDEVDEKWEELTETLFVTLQSELRAGIALDFPTLHGDLKTWLPLENPNKQYQWTVASRMLLCASQASCLPRGDSNEIQRLRLVLANMPEILKGHEDWAVDCVRLLLGDTPPTTRRLDIPVALSDELTATQGTLATLCLELAPFPPPMLGGGGGGRRHESEPWFRGLSLPTTLIAHLPSAEL